MRRIVAVLGLALSLPPPSTAWAGDNSAVAYPRYEPPAMEDLPEMPKAPAADEIAGGQPAAPEPAERPHIEAAAPAPEPEAAPMQTPTPEPAATPTPVVTPKLTTYKVWVWQENGDCLWRIAEKMYGDRSKWKLIYLANKDVIKDPNKIYPKQRLKIPPADWIPAE